MFRIVQALSTIMIGLIIGLIYIWKVGLVGLGIFSHTYQHGVFTDADGLA
jgi:hypothetical protein